MTGVEIEPVTKTRRPALENLMQLYFHDFSDFLAMSENGELQEDGRYGPYGPLDSYWRDEGRQAWFVRCGGRLAGFALVNAATHSGLAADRNMAEFFIVRGHRRNGAGSAAARAVIAASPGLWEVAVMAANTPALAFWPRAIAGLPGVGPIERLDLAGPGWTGPIFRFSSPER